MGFFQKSESNSELTLSAEYIFSTDHYFNSAEYAVQKWCAVLPEKYRGYFRQLIIWHALFWILLFYLFFCEECLNILEL